jgi:hypothetical protein
MKERAARERAEEEARARAAAAAAAAAAEAGGEARRLREGEEELAAAQFRSWRCAQS